MSDQVFYTLEWTAGIEIFDTSYNRVAESSQQVTFTLPKFSQNSFHIDDAQEAAVIEMNLNKHLSLCYLILKSTDGGQQQPEYLDLYGWVFNNWIVAGSSSPELVRKSIPENTIYLEENPKKEIIDKSFVTWGGEEYEYTLFSQLKVLNESSEAPTNANLLSPKPIEEAKQCIAASPQVILRSLQDL